MKDRIQELKNELAAITRAKRYFTEIERKNRRRARPQCETGSLSSK